MKNKINFFDIIFYYHFKFASLGKESNLKNAGVAAFLMSLIQVIILEFFVGLKFGINQIIKNHLVHWGFVTLLVLLSIYLYSFVFKHRRYIGIALLMNQSKRYQKKGIFYLLIYIIVLWFIIFLGML